MTSSNGNIFRVTGHLYGEFTGHRIIPRTKVSDAEHWCFILSDAWINAWVNNREAGDLRRHRAHYDVIVMVYQNYCSSKCKLIPSWYVTPLATHWFSGSSGHSMRVQVATKLPSSVREQKQELQPSSAVKLSPVTTMTKLRYSFNVKYFENRVTKLSLLLEISKHMKLHSDR